MTGFPRVPSAFINAIAEEGTKAEAVKWLQSTWDELCHEKKQRQIAELKNKGTLANNLCPDHRDKQVGKPCLACEAERLTKQRDRLLSALEWVIDYAPTGADEAKCRAAITLGRIP